MSGDDDEFLRSLEAERNALTLRLADPDPTPRDGARRVLSKIEARIREHREILRSYLRAAYPPARSVALASCNLLVIPVAFGAVSLGLNAAFWFVLP